MRRLLAGSVLLAALGGVGALAVDGASEAPYRVAVVFDTAKGMVPGQQVKVAGGRVGEVEEVRLTPERKARMVLAVDARFEPFHRDAGCRILPEGLISENYVECDPGTAKGGKLPPDRTGVPTIPVEHTKVPVAVQDVINVFSRPTNERLRLLLSELGLATAGRGEDLNAVLRRANPALTQSRRVLTILESERAQLTRAVGQTDRVLHALARHDDDVRGFVDRAAVVARTTAGHRRALSATVGRLPPMLDSVRPGLRSLDRAMADATPLLDSLRASAPGLLSLTSTLPAFSRQGEPALRSLASAARQGRTAVRSARPVVSLVKDLSRSAGPFARELDRLLLSARDEGAIEGVMKFLYSLATDSAAYDEISHILGIYVGVYPKCFAEPAPPECIHAYSGPGQGTVPVNAPERGPQATRPQESRRRFGMSSSPDGRKPRGARVPRAVRGRDPAKRKASPSLPHDLPLPGGDRRRAPADPSLPFLDYLLR